MRPFPSQLNEDGKVFNHRQSRGRRVIENTFRISRARWRILGRTIKATVKNVKRYLLVIMALHNYLRRTENASYCPTESFDFKNSSGIDKPGEWRSVVVKVVWCSRELPNVGGSKSRQDLLDFRSGIKDCFKTELRQIDWLVDWLIGWLIDWLTGWLIDRADWLVIFSHETHMKRKM